MILGTEMLKERLNIGDIFPDKLGNPKISKRRLTRCELLAMAWWLMAKYSVLGMAARTL